MTLMGIFLDEIKHLFEMGLASPNDSLETGQSIITVRSVLLSMNKLMTLDVSNYYVFGTAFYSVHQSKRSTSF